MLVNLATPNGYTYHVSSFSLGLLGHTIRLMSNLVKFCRKGVKYETGMKNSRFSGNIYLIRLHVHLKNDIKYLHAATVFLKPACTAAAGIY